MNGQFGNVCFSFSFGAGTHFMPRQNSRQMLTSYELVVQTVPICCWLVAATQRHVWILMTLTQVLASCDIFLPDKTRCQYDAPIGPDSTALPAQTYSYVYEHVAITWNTPNTRCQRKAGDVTRRHRSSGGDEKQPSCNTVGSQARSKSPIAGGAS
jgi:hypothetical protein